MEIEFDIKDEQIDNAIDELLSSLKSGQFKRDFGNSLFEKQSKDLDNIIRHCVDIYYNKDGSNRGYTPKKYKRKGSLYDMYRITQKGVDYNIETGPFSDKTHRVSNDYIFDKMWMEGFHGGATFNPSSDKMIDKAGRMHPFAPDGLAYRAGPGFIFWNLDPVAQTDSIEELAIEGINEYESNNGLGSDRFWETAIEILGNYELFNMFNK